MPKGNAIPTAARKAVADRDRGRCQRCGMAGHEWHHRKRRGGSDPHRHCVCIGITLCGACHRTVHANPARSREEGFIVSKFTDATWDVPIRTFHGVVTNRCDGTTESFLPGKIAGGT